jgi:hypothetical protein
MFLGSESACDMLKDYYVSHKGMDEQNILGTATVNILKKLCNGFPSGILCQKKYGTETS